jgi:hypothetical protein
MGVFKPDYRIVFPGPSIAGDSKVNRHRSPRQTEQTGPFTARWSGIEKLVCDLVPALDADPVVLIDGKRD